jgi:hypothetical protein
MNYLGGLVCDGKCTMWILEHMLVQMCSSGCCSGWPLRIKEINKASMLRCTSSATLWQYGLCLD